MVALDVKLTTHLMIDLETLDVSRDAVILSCGLVIFNRQEVIEKKHLHFDPRIQIRAGRTVSASTVKWWLMTNRVGFASLCTDGLMELRELEEIIKYLYNWYLVDRVWSCGSFDLEILKDSMATPWVYSQERDVRTFTELGKMKGNGHDALQDCLNQVEFVQRILNNKE